MPDQKETIKRFEHAVAAYMQSHGMPGRDQKIIVALSGGADSVALLAVLTALGYECVAAHCNFHLRGPESTRDMHHAQHTAEVLQTDISVKHFDTAAHAKATGQSIEMAARQLRYDWFTEVLEREHAAAIAVAHHREDQAETFMLNLLRTTGLTGLAGMRPVNGLVIRPLLDVSRKDIEDYLHARGLSFVTDSSNTDNTIKRNRLRNVVLPAIEDAFDGAGDAILATMHNLAGNLALYDHAVKELSARYTADGGCTVNLGRIKQQLPPAAARTLLYEILKPHGFNATHAANLADATDSAFVQAGRHTATLSRGAVTIAALGDTPSPAETSVTLRHNITHPVQIEVTECHISQFAPERDPGTAYFDVRILHPDRPGQPLPHFAIRPWRRGDRMQPFGLGGSKLLSDIFADAKLTSRQKQNIRLLCRNNTVIWAIGLRASALFSVTPRTKQYLRLHLKDTL